ncbi:MAG: hypothetical protein LBV51_00355, partial [Acholeplasmatales bacterium]|nr:hypothetical protein [Acholeplasmatales bacterium]
YFSEVNSVNFSVGASIYVGSNTASDNFPKVGFKIKGDNKEVFFFIDVNASRNNNWGNYVVRPQGQDWIWAETEGIRQYVFLGDTSYNKNYKDLELIKVGSAIYFVSDGKVVQYAEGLFSEDEKVVVGILAFNLNLRIQNVFQASSGLEFENKLSEYKISAKEGSVIDGDISDWSSESLQNPLLIPTINNKNIKVYAYLEVDGIYIAYDALHDKYVNNKESWYENTNAEFRLEDSVRRYLNSKGTYSRHEIDSSCADVGYGKIVTTGGAGAYHSIAEIFIPWAMTPWSYSTKLTVAGGFAWKTETETIFIDGWINNDFVYTVEADPTVKSKIITREGFYKGEDLVIDGNLDDWDNTIISSSLEGTNLNRNYQTNMFLGSDGLYGYVKITTNNPLNLSDFSNSWSVNENIEFWINNADPSVRAFIANNIIYSSGFISSIAYTYNNSTKELLFEFFVVYSNIPGYINSDSVVTIRLGCASIDGGWFMPINTDTVVNSLGLSV